MSTSNGAAHGRPKRAVRRRTMPGFIVGDECDTEFALEEENCRAATGKEHANKPRHSDHGSSPAIESGTRTRKQKGHSKKQLCTPPTRGVVNSNSCKNSYRLNRTQSKSRAHRLKVSSEVERCAVKVESYSFSELHHTTGVNTPPTHLDDSLVESRDLCKPHDEATTANYTPPSLKDTNSGDLEQRPPQLMDAVEWLRAVYNCSSDATTAYVDSNATSGVTTAAATPARLAANNHNDGSSSGDGRTQDFEYACKVKKCESFGDTAAVCTPGTGVDNADRVECNTRSPRKDACLVDPQAAVDNHFHDTDFGGNTTAEFDSYTDATDVPTKVEHTSDYVAAAVTPPCQVASGGGREDRFVGGDRNRSAAGVKEEASDDNSVSHDGNGGGVYKFRAAGRGKCPNRTPKITSSGRSRDDTVNCGAAARPAGQPVWSGSSYDPNQGQADANTTLHPLLCPLQLGMGAASSTPNNGEGKSDSADQSPSAVGYPHDSTDLDSHRDAAKQQQSPAAHAASTLMPSGASEGDCESSADTCNSNSFDVAVAVAAAAALAASGDSDTRTFRGVENGMPTAEMLERFCVDVTNQSGVENVVSSSPTVFIDPLSGSANSLHSNPSEHSRRDTTAFMTNRFVGPESGICEPNGYSTTNVPTDNPHHQHGLQQHLHLHPDPNIFPPLSGNPVGMNIDHHRHQEMGAVANSAALHQHPHQHLHHPHHIQQQHAHSRFQQQHHNPLMAQHHHQSQMYHPYSTAAPTAASMYPHLQSSIYSNRADYLFVNPHERTPAFAAMGGFNDNGLFDITEVKGVYKNCRGIWAAQWTDEKGQRHTKYFNPKFYPSEAEARLEAYRFKVRITREVALRGRVPRKRHSALLNAALLSATDCLGAYSCVGATESVKNRHPRAQRRPRGNITSDASRKRHAATYANNNMVGQYTAAGMNVFGSNTNEILAASSAALNPAGNQGFMAPIDGSNNNLFMGTAADLQQMYPSTAAAQLTADYNKVASMLSVPSNNGGANGFNGNSHLHQQQPNNMHLPRENCQQPLQICDTIFSNNAYWDLQGGRPLTTEEEIRMFQQQMQYGTAPANIPVNTAEPDPPQIAPDTSAGANVDAVSNVPNTVATAATECAELFEESSRCVPTANDADEIDNGEASSAVSFFAPKASSEEAVDGEVTTAPGVEVKPLGDVEGALVNVNISNQQAQQTHLQNYHQCLAKSGILGNESAPSTQPTDGMQQFTFNSAEVLGALNDLHHTLDSRVAETETAAQQAPQDCSGWTYAENSAAYSTDTQQTNPLLYLPQGDYAPENIHQLNAFDGGEWNTSWVVQQQHQIPNGNMHGEAEMQNVMLQARSDSGAAAVPINCIITANNSEPCDNIVDNAASVAVPATDAVQESEPDSILETLSSFERSLCASPEQTSSGDHCKSAQTTDQQTMEGVEARVITGAKATCELGLQGMTEANSDEVQYAFQQGVAPNGIQADTTSHYAAADAVSENTINKNSREEPELNASAGPPIPDERDLTDSATMQNLFSASSAVVQRNISSRPNPLSWTNICKFDEAFRKEAGDRALSADSTASLSTAPTLWNPSIDSNLSPEMFLEDLPLPGSRGSAHHFATKEQSWPEDVALDLSDRLV